MNAIDARLDAACKRHMKEWSLADFKESHPSLYCAIVEAIDIALHTPLSPAVPAPEPSKVVEPWVAVSDEEIEKKLETLTEALRGLNYEPGFFDGASWMRSRMPLPPAPKEDGK